tara:strand:+ start:10905 stop:12419 length:1515 start_codon:yes stop_codon:yes gene_type:complete
MKYISLFSGIEAASVAWHDLGWDPVAFADIDEFPSAVLAHHYPHVRNVGDVMKHEWKNETGKAELIVGGSPCQSFSVAGHRLGMDDPRGNLALHFLKIIREVRPKWFIYENVPGLLSSGGGSDFAAFLGEVAECGYGFAYRVLDAQNFGVPQRRRRVFVVGCADGDWRSAAAVLFEPTSLCGDIKKSKEKGQDTSLFAEQSLSGTGRKVSAKGIDHQAPYHDPAPTLDANYGVGAGMRAGIERQVIGVAIPIHDKATRFKGGGKGRNDDGGGNALGIGDEEQPMYSLDTNGNHAVFTIDAHNSNSMKSGNPHSGVHESRISPTLDCGDPSPNKYQGGVAIVQGSAESSFGSFQDSDKSGVLKASGGVLGGGSETLVTESAGVVSKGNGEVWETEEQHMSLTSGGGQAGQGYPAVRQSANAQNVVRRLTPTECERLQGFPDDWTKIPFKGKTADECPQGHRYKALGNSMAVPVMKWLGQRIQMVDIVANDLQREEAVVSKQTQLW